MSKIYLKRVKYINCDERISCHHPDGRKCYFITDPPWKENEQCTKYCKAAIIYIEVKSE